METLFDFSAAPHLPLSLRESLATTPRPELALNNLSSAAQSGRGIVVLERNGELYVSFA